MSTNTLTLVQEVYFDLCDLITTNRLGGKIQGFHEFETLRDFVEEQRNKLEAIEKILIKETINQFILENK